MKEKINLKENIMSLIGELQKHPTLKGRELEFDYNQTDRDIFEDEEHMFNRKFIERVKGIEEDINEFHITFEFSEIESVYLTFQMAVNRDPRENLRIGVTSDISSWIKDAQYGDIMDLNYCQELPYDIQYGMIKTYLILIGHIKTTVELVHELDRYQLNPFAEQEPETTFYERNK